MRSKPGPRPTPSKPKSRRSHRELPQGLSISSWSALEEYLRAKPEAIEQLICSGRDERRLRDLLMRYGQDKPLRTEESGFEGFSAEIRIAYGDEEEFYERAAARSRDMIVACDHITDTRNLGALARTAAFFGLGEILVPKDRQAPISSATLAVAQGAFATLVPIQVTNLARSLERLKECGYWVVCADMAGTPLPQFQQKYEKTVLVLGSEDRGLSPLILGKSDVRISIPSPAGNLESLNVSVAAGILIHALHQHFKGN